jgi:hypothetical protein
MEQEVQKKKNLDVQYTSGSVLDYLLETEFIDIDLSTSNDFVYLCFHFVAVSPNIYPSSVCNFVEVSKPAKIYTVPVRH